jgi:hypothetical protein
MATSYDVARAEARDYDIAGSGWVTFAAVMLGLAGTFNFFDGILAVSKSRFYTHDATYLFSNLNTWGWIMMILGILFRTMSGPDRRPNVGVCVHFRDRDH